MYFEKLLKIIFGVIEENYSSLKIVSIEAKEEL